MLSWRQRRAIKLMFQKSDDEVAAEVGVEPRTVKGWRLRNPRFREALAAEEKDIRLAAARIASDVSLSAARNLHKLLAEAKDGKLSLDILKASGAFDKQETGDENVVENLIRLAKEKSDAVET